MSRYCCARPNTVLKHSPEKVAQQGGGGGGTSTHFFPPDFKKFINGNFHNGVGVVSSWLMTDAAEPPSQKKKKKSDARGFGSKCR